MISQNAKDRPERFPQRMAKAGRQDIIRKKERDLLGMIESEATNCLFACKENRTAKRTGQSKRVYASAYTRAKTRSILRVHQRPWENRIKR